ncbi:MAG: DUF445 domain-containing protein [Bacillota bacterium]
MSNTCTNPEGEAMGYSLLLIPVISALIGWLTNIVAIRMLFRPYRPVKIPFINYALQGVFPKRQPELAKNLGRVVEEQLLCAEDVVCHVSSQGVIDNLSISAKEIIKGRIVEKIPKFFPISIRRGVGNIADEILAREIPRLTDRLVSKLHETLGEELQVAEIVECKVNSLEIAELERLIMGFAEKELRFVEILGGVLGFLLGCVQLLIAYLAQA